MARVAVSAAVEARPSEERLIEAARDGDVEAFGLLYERHKNVVYSFVAASVGRREDAEDIVQDVFCRAWRAISSFRGEARLTTWLCRIAVNACTDHARRERRHRNLAVHLDSDAAGEAPQAVQVFDPESEWVARRAVEDALNALPESHRMLVVLCDVNGLTAREAAQVVGSTQISVRVRLCRARKRLREMLAELLDEADKT